MYDAASTILAQKLSQVDGVGQVTVGGSSLPGVRVELNPHGAQQIRHRPRGRPHRALRRQRQRAQGPFRRRAATPGPSTTTTSSSRRSTTSRSSSPTAMPPRCASGDIASVQSTRSRTSAPPVSPTASLPSCSIIFRQPGANIIDTVDRIYALAARAASLDSPGHRSQRRHGPHDDHPRLDPRRRAHAGHLHRAGHPGGLRLPARCPHHAHSRRRGAGLAHRHLRRHVPARLQPRQSFAHGADHLDRLRRRRRDRRDGKHHALSRERACRRSRPRLRGSREIGFTVLSISISLVAVFIPILLMGGIVGRLFREFAVTLSVAILVSMVISLTTTPMMCALLLKPEKKHARPDLSSFSEYALRPAAAVYESPCAGAAPSGAHAPRPRR